MGKRRCYGLKTPDESDIRFFGTAIRTFDGACRMAFSESRFRSGMVEVWLQPSVRAGNQRPKPIRLMILTASEGATDADVSV